MTISTNKELNQLHGVRLKYNCKQAPNVGMGVCYGYSSKWALHEVLHHKDAWGTSQDTDNEIDVTNETTSTNSSDSGKEIDSTNETISATSSDSEDEIEISGEIDREKEEEIKESIRFKPRIILSFTRDVKKYQDSAVLPRHERNARLFLFHRGLRNLLDGLNNELTTDEAAILLCRGIIGGHALAIKKRDDGKIIFFDCNMGKHIIKDMETFKQWLPAYLDINYAGYFYKFSTDIVRKKATSPLSNLTKSFDLASMLFLTAPLGIFHAVRAIKRVITQKINKSQTKSEKDKPVSFGSTTKKLHESLPITVKPRSLSVVKEKMSHAPDSNFRLIREAVVKNGVYDSLLEKQRISFGRRN